MSQTTLYEGKAKKMYPLPADVSGYPDSCWVQEFKDDLTAFNAEKKSNESGKGACNQKISSRCFEFLGLCGFDTHFVGSLSATKQVIQKLNMSPVECVVRRVAAGSLVKRLGIPQGTRFHPMMYESFFKEDALGDPLMAPVHVPVLAEGMTPQHLNILEVLSVSIFSCLEVLFQACELMVVDGKIEFGQDDAGKWILADEISPDTLRLWTPEGKKLDKDVFREDLGSVVTAYEEVWKRLSDVNIEDLASALKKGLSSKSLTLQCDVMPKSGVLDPEGEAALDTTSTEAQISHITAGKSFRVTYTNVFTGHHLKYLEHMCQETFSNPLIQDYAIQLCRS